MPKGKKNCQSCGAENGAKSHSCIKCNNQFVVKKTKHQPHVIVTTPEEPKEPKKLDWKTLKKNDRIRVLAGSGSYWPSSGESGATNMGYYGKFTVVSVREDGILANGNTKEGGMCFIYMGPRKETKYGMVRMPHKIVKLKDKKER